MATTVVPMDQLLQGSQELVLPEPGQMVTGTVLSISKSAILVDLGLLTGIIPGRERRDAMNTASELEVGDEVVSCVIDTENPDGLVVLSLRKASQEKTWNHFQDAYDKSTVITVVPKEANKGGLLLNADGIKGFIPVSQLAPMNYPRVNGADSAKILSRLEKLVGKKFDVKVINIDREAGKLILSERAAYKEERDRALDKLNMGSTVEGTISGIVKFGIFVAFDGLEGLVHISEIAWGHVNNPHDFGKLGDKVNVKVIGVEGDKISLSMKQLTKDPWEMIEEKYKIGTEVNTKISRLAQFGAFVELEADINGLIHSSQIPGNPKDPAEALEVGQDVKATVIEINKDEKRVGLSLLSEEERAAQSSHSEPEEAAA